VPVIGVHDDMVWSSGPFANPAWYRRFVFPTLKRYLDPLREAGKIIVFCCDGDFTPFLGDLVEAGVSGFVLEPWTDMRAIAERYGKTHFFIGNADTRVLLRGGREEIRAEVKRCMDIGKSCPGFIMAVGNHIPPNTPIEHALWYNEAYEEMCRR
jgi:uroporphyrinogen-III decarboxylase